MEINSILKTWSEKTIQTYDELQQLFNEYVSTVKSEQPNLNEDEQKTKAMIVLKSALTRQFSSPAVPYEGVVTIDKGLRDWNITKFKWAKDFYNKNPQEAIDKGYTNEKGEPLFFVTPDEEERIPEWRKSLIGKPLSEHSYSRTIEGIGKLRDSTDKPKPFIQYLNGKVAQQDIPMFVPITSKCNNKTKEGDEILTFNSSAFSVFKPTAIEGLPDMKTLFSTFYNEQTTRITNLKSYYEMVREDKNRFVVVKGMVDYIDEDAKEKGKRGFIIVNDIDIGDKDFENLEMGVPSVQCWIPEHIAVDFGVRSEVYVFGRPDLITKLINGEEVKDEQGNTVMSVCINVYGIYPDPEKIVGGATVEKKDLNGDDLKVEEEPEAEGW